VSCSGDKVDESYWKRSCNVNSARHQHSNFHDGKNGGAKVFICTNNGDSLGLIGL
jgi:hypothetical protein